MVKDRRAEDRLALERLLDVCGADRTRWPARERLRFASFIGEDEGAKRLLAEADALDSLLDLAPRYAHRPHDRWRRKRTREHRLHEFETRHSLGSRERGKWILPGHRSRPCFGAGQLINPKPPTGSYASVNPSSRQS